MVSTRPNPIRTDGSNAWAHHSMTTRVPDIIEQTIERNPDYSSYIKDALAELRDRIAGDDELFLPRLPAPDYDLWNNRLTPFRGETWLNSEWFFGEMLAYRLMLDACQYWSTGRDPFKPFKEEEIASEAMWETLEASRKLDGDLDERLGPLLLGALWGNRMDLSVQAVMEQGTEATDEHLLTDDIPQVSMYLLSQEAGAVHIIMDNAGTEQLLDFTVVEILLKEGLASTITLHVKMQPVLVSDVIGADITYLLEAMRARGGEAEKLADRLYNYVSAGRLRIVPDFFWSMDGRLWELPRRLAASFDGATLVIGKGDVNYRRATNDAVWPVEATLADAIGGFPAPLLLLRTIKSDTLVGVEADIVHRLDGQEAGWRTRGTYGVAQFVQ